MTFDIEHWEMNKSGVERLGECIFTLHNRGGLQGTGGDGDVSGKISKYPWTKYNCDIFCSMKIATLHEEEEV